MPRLEYDNFMTICSELQLQPNHLFACLRKSVGVSQAKLAYRINHEHITQNTISRYEHKNNITAEYEYILWSYMLGYLKNEYHLRRKVDKIRYATVILNTFDLYVLRYADNSEVINIDNYISEVLRTTLA